MADLINIKFPDGKSTKIEKGLSGFDIAKKFQFLSLRQLLLLRLMEKY